MGSAVIIGYNIGNVKYNNMKCPKCDKEMIIKTEDTSSNSRNNKQYDRKVYWCEQDDIWINLEIPKEI